MRVQVTDAVMSLSSGFGKNVEMGFRGEALHLFDFFDWMDRAFQPLNDAWSQIWAVGSQDAINAADLLFKASADLMRSAMSSEQNAGWLQSAIKGEPWTDEQRAILTDAVRGVVRARVAFAAIMRRETAREPAEFLLGRSERRRASEQSQQNNSG
jgi:hypothetical protein